MKLEPINIVCPACGNPNYMRRIIGENVDYFNTKCLNCLSYFNFEEISTLKKFPQLLPDDNGIKVTTNSGEHKEEKMSGLIKFERYKLVLRHEFVDGENVCEIEKPIVVQYCVDRSCRGSSIIVNEMIEKLRHHMLSVIEAEDGT